VATFTDGHVSLVLVMADRNKPQLALKANLFH